MPGALKVKVGGTYVPVAFSNAPGDPVGSIQAWGGSDAPAGWLLCDGAAYSRTTYAVLFAVIGTTYGVGNGSTTFNVPNLKGKVPVGRDASQTEFDTLGESGGAKTHTLTIPEMPAHNHEVRANVGTAAPAALNLDDIPGSDGPISATNQIVGGATMTGGGGAHNNLQPYLAVNYVIKYDAASPGLDQMDWAAGTPLAAAAFPTTVTTIPIASANFRGSGVTLVTGGAQMGGFQINKAGTYHLVGITNSSHVSGTAGLQSANVAIYRGGALLRRVAVVSHTVVGNYATANVTETADLLVGDVVCLQADTNATGTINYTAAETRLSVHRLAGAGPEGPRGPGGGAASVSLNLTGPWPTAVPGPTTGTAFTTPAGVLRGIVTADAWSSAAGTAMSVEAYLDGVNVTPRSITVQPSLTPNVHQPLQGATFSATVTAGTHYLAYRLISGNTDSNCFGTFFGVVTTATGTLDDPITVLNARLTADLNYPTPSVWQNLSGWSILHRYPDWAPENGGYFYVPADGYYRVEVLAQPNHATAARAAAVVINNVMVTQSNTAASSGVLSSSAVCWWEGNLRAGDSVAGQVWVNAATSISLGSAINAQTRLVIRKVIAGGVPASASPDTPWTAMPLVNTWADYGAPWETGAYRRVGGVVYLRGLIRPGASQSGGAVIFTLPTGFRPNSDQHTSVNTNNQFATINIYADGRVSVNTPITAGWWMSMRSVPPFPADQ